MRIAKLISVSLMLGVLFACESATDISPNSQERSTLNFVHNNSPDISAMSINKKDKHKGLAIFRRATARYHDVEQAIEDGFEEILPCTENPEGPGALGVVYANLDRFDTIIDLNKPEILFYEPQKNGKLRLVGGEPVVPIDLWPESNPPSLFGREFHKNEDHGLYGLHMWIWKYNPEGTFAFWHPEVSCAYAE